MSASRRPSADSNVLLIGTVGKPAPQFLLIQLWDYSFKSWNLATNSNTSYFFFNDAIYLTINSTNYIIQ